MLSWDEKDGKLLSISMNSLGKREDVNDEDIEKINESLKSKTKGKVSVRRSSSGSSALVVTEYGEYKALNLIELIDILQSDLDKSKEEKKRKRRKRITEKMKAKIVENDKQKGNVKRFIRENKISVSTYYRVLRESKMALNREKLEF